MNQAATLTGANDFAVQNELRKLVGMFVAEQGEIGLERIDADEADFQQIYDALTSMPFLANKKMVIIKNPSNSAEFAERAEYLLKNLPETTDLILVETKIDKRSSIYKLLKKTTDFREFDELNANDLTNWLVREAKSKNGTLSPVDARFLVERVGTNQQLLANELNKLLTYDLKISRSNIGLLTESTPQSTIFELLDAAFNNNHEKTFELYAEQRALKVEPHQIVAMLTWQLHILALIKTAGQRSSEEIAKQAKLNPFVVRKGQALARRISLKEVERLLDDLLELDVKIKSETVSSDEALQFFLINLNQNQGVLN